MGGSFAASSSRIRGQPGSRWSCFQGRGTSANTPPRSGPMASWSNRSTLTSCSAPLKGTAKARAHRKSNPPPAPEPARTNRRSVGEADPGEQGLKAWVVSQRIQVWVHVEEWQPEGVLLICFVKPLECQVRFSKLGKDLRHPKLRGVFVVRALQVILGQSQNGPPILFGALGCREIPH